MAAEGWCDDDLNDLDDTDTDDDGGGGWDDDGLEGLEDSDTNDDTAPAAVAMSQTKNPLAVNSNSNDCNSSSSHQGGNVEDDPEEAIPLTGADAVAVEAPRQKEGWEDDDDDDILNFDDNDDNDDDDDNHAEPHDTALTSQETPVLGWQEMPTRAATAGTLAGASAGEHHGAVSSTTRTSTSEPEVAEDGWGDDDELGLLDESEETPERQETAENAILNHAEGQKSVEPQLPYKRSAQENTIPELQNTTAAILSSEPQRSNKAGLVEKIPSSQNDGWNDEFNFDDDDDDESPALPILKPPAPTVAAATTAAAVKDGWNDEFDFNDTDSGANSAQVPIAAFDSSSAIRTNNDDNESGRTEEIDTAALISEKKRRNLSVSGAPAVPESHVSGWNDEELDFSENSEQRLAGVGTATVVGTRNLPSQHQSTGIELAKPKLPSIEHARSTRFKAGQQLSSKQPAATGGTVEMNLPTTSTTVREEAETGGGEGWNDDFDFDDELETGSPPAIAESHTSTIQGQKLEIRGTGFSGGRLKAEQQPAKTKETAVVIPEMLGTNDLDVDDASNNEWNDDFDFSFNDEEPAKVQSVPAPPPRNPRQQKLLEDVENYIEQLGHLQSSINAVLQFEYNTPEKARELVDYYTERPGLKDYTIQKELSRMEYSAMLPGGDEICSKSEISNLLKNDSTLLSRCANQSLLADLLQVFTGSDMLVRPQYLATAVATVCRFRMDLHSLVVQVNASFELSLPTEQRRWTIAEVNARILFGVSDSPFVQYDVTSIRPTVSRTDNESWRANIGSVVDLLSSMHEDESEQLPRVGSEQNFRDVFLAQSQNVLQNSAEGIKSALGEIESVVGISNKLKQIPSFLPDDVIQAAEEHTLPSPGKQRPTSILGGLVRTGWSKIAQSVALPDEDPSLYQNWQANQQVPEKQQAAAAEPPLLYQKEPQPPPRSAPPMFHHQEQKPPPARPPPPKPRPPAPKGRPPQMVPTNPSPAADPPEEHEQPQTKLLNSATFPATSLTSPLPAPSAEGKALISPPLALPLPVGSSKLGGSYKNSLEGVISTDCADTSTSNRPHNGWEDEEEDRVGVFDGDTDTTSNKPTINEEQLQAPALSVRTIQEPAVQDWQYDPEDDIIPLRKRWDNPRPAMRRLRASISSF